MHTQKRIIWFSLAALFALVINFAAPIAALADDGTSGGGTSDPAPSSTPTTDPQATTTSGISPTDTTDPQATATPVASPTVTTDSQATDTSVAAPTATDDPTSTVTADPSAMPAPDSTATPSLPDILSQSPAGTQVVVLDSNGQPVSLATQQGASILTNGDPMWCPGTALPGDSSCTTSFDVFSTNGADTGLLDYLAANSAIYNGAGTIYVASTYDSSLEPGDVVIDGSSLAGLTDLTLQGGWDFGLNAVSGGNSVFNGTSLTVTNWNNGNITINNVDVTGSTGGLQVDTTNDATLNDVNVSGTTDNNGITVNALGKATMNSVTSNDNSGTGATVSAGGDIAVNDSQFNGNGTSASTTSSTVGGTHTESAAGFSGLQASSDSNVTLQQVWASCNGLDGANLDGYDVSVTDGQFFGNGFTGYYSYSTVDDLTNTETHEFFQAGNGLTVYAGDTATLSGVEASGNAGNGADISHSANLSVTDSLANTSQFNDNGFGADFSPYTSLPVLGSIDTAAYYAYNETKSDTTTQDFLDAHVSAGTGLVTNSTSDSTLVDVTAEGNAGSGGNSYSSGGDVNVIGGLFNGNGENGSLDIYLANNADSTNTSISGSLVQGSGFELNALGTGSAFLSDVSAEGNSFYGAYVDTNAGPIIVSGGNFNGNGYGSFDGFSSVSLGLTMSTDPGFSQNSDFNWDLSSGGGLYAYTSSGGIDLLNVIADGNAGNGAHAFAAETPLTVSSSTFEGNGSVGETYGDVTTNQNLVTSAESTTMYQYQNSQSGLYGSGGSVTLLNVVANGNSFDGAEVYAVTGNASVAGGSFVDNGYTGQTYSFDIVSTDDGPDSGTFNYYGSGLYASSDHGSISLNAVTASDNSVNGADLFTVPNDTSVVCSTMDDNGAYGVQTYSATTELLGTELLGNGSGPYNVESGVPVISTDCNPASGPQPGGNPSPLPIHQIPVTGDGAGQTADLNCVSFSGTLISLPDRDHVLFYCKTIGQGTLDQIKATDPLPADLPQGDTFVSGMDAHVTLNGQNLDLLPSPMTVAFNLTDDLKNATLAILYWDPTAKNGVGDWVELPERAFVSPAVDKIFSLHTPTDGKLILVGTHQTPEGYFQANVNFTGTFILVKK